MGRTITNEDVANYILKKFEKQATNFDQSFVRRKKILRDIALGVSPDVLSLKTEKKRRRERAEEIEKVKKQRKLRTMEKARKEEEMVLLDRKRDWIESELGKKGETEFAYHQSKIRSQIRLQEGRAKPIDILINQLNPLNDLNMKIDGSLPPLYAVLENLTVKELEEIEDEIKLHLQFDKATPVHTQYWEALLVVCDWELAKGRLMDARGRTRADGGDELESCLLFAEERGIHSSIESDVKKFLLGKSYAELEAQQSQIESKITSGETKLVEFWESLRHRMHIFKAKAMLKEISEKHLRGLDRRTQQEESTTHTAADDESEEPELLGLDNDDKCEPAATIEKFTPRKPKYLNRVHTGYQWNKYNRIHYDHNNPPPKYVLGYKFNVFYPDLIDPSKAPNYLIVEDQDSSTCIIKFHGGPPYEDIAFRIVNGEWEYSKKKGFKCRFERGILQLNFNFKRYPYRR